jgi:hypothetical protein
MSHPLYELLQRLEDARIHFTIARNRSDTICVSVTRVSERIEIDVFEDGDMEVARFIGSEGIAGGAEMVDRLIDGIRE